MLFSNILIRSLGGFIVLFFVINNFDYVEITLFNIFILTISSYMMLDLGFGTTFSRLITYSISMNEQQDKKGKDQYLRSHLIYIDLFYLLKLMKKIYLVLAIIFLIIIHIRILKISGLQLEN